MTTRLQKDVDHIKILIQKQAHQQAYLLLYPLLLSQPQHAELRSLAAELAFLEGDYLQACSHLTVALNQKPLDLAITHQYLWVLCLLKRFEDMIMYSQVYKLELYQHAETYFLEAYALEHLHRYPESILYYEKCLAINPSHRKGLFSYGQLALNVQKNEQAQDLLATLCTHYPNESEHWYLYAQALIRCHHYPKGIKAFHKALKLRHDYTWIHYDLAKVYMQSEQFAKAKKHYQLSLVTQPIQYKSYYYLARLALKQDQIDQAISYLTCYLPYAKVTEEIPHMIMKLKRMRSH